MHKDTEEEFLSVLSAGSKVRIHIAQQSKKDAVKLVTSTTNTGHNTLFCVSKCTNQRNAVYVKHISFASDPHMLQEHQSEVSNQIFLEARILKEKILVLFPDISIKIYDNNADQI